MASTRNRADARRWSTGALARATGLTVRTLHHYDEIGLVSAGERTASGHRRYTEADVRRLYRVRALRALGLSLREIRAVLRDSGDDLTTLRELLTAQLGELEAKAELIARLRQRIGDLLDRLGDAELPEPERFMTTLELASAAEVYFTPEQRDRLIRRHDELGEQAVAALRTEAVGLLRRIRQHQLDRTPVDDPRVQALTSRVDELGASFNDGDERLTAAANDLWRENHAEISRSLGLPAPDQAPDLVTYLRQARRARQAGPR